MPRINIKYDPLGELTQDVYQVTQRCRNCAWPSRRPFKVERFYEIESNRYIFKAYSKCKACRELSVVELYVDANFFKKDKITDLDIKKKIPFIKLECPKNKYL